MRFSEDEFVAVEDKMRLLIDGRVPACFLRMNEVSHGVWTRDIAKELELLGTIKSKQLRYYKREDDKKNKAIAQALLSGETPPYDKNYILKRLPHSYYHPSRIALQTALEVNAYRQWEVTTRLLPGWINMVCNARFITPKDDEQKEESGSIQAEMEIMVYCVLTIADPEKKLHRDKIAMPNAGNLLNWVWFTAPRSKPLRLQVIQIDPVHKSVESSFGQYR
ncbi:hypothetical protein LTR66_016657 [Elasticomyces elasticus]|nr:hypothetical protein LTR66_016657 [Elasticomyces elasticus]